MASGALRSTAGARPSPRGACEWLDTVSDAEDRKNGTVKVYFRKFCRIHCHSQFHYTKGLAGDEPQKLRRGDEEADRGNSVFKVFMVPMPVPGLRTVSSSLKVESNRSNVGKHELGRFATMGTPLSWTTALVRDVKWNGSM